MRNYFLYKDKNFIYFKKECRMITLKTKELVMIHLGCGGPTVMD